jgi:hypothetical protein
MATRQPPKLLHFAISPLVQMASAQVNSYRLGIAQQLSENDGYYSGQSTCREGNRAGNRDRIQKMNDKNKDLEMRQGD